MDNKISFLILTIFAVVLVIGFAIAPSFSADNVFIINRGGSGNTTSGVTSLESDNGAITLNNDTGSITISPRWKLLAQNSTIGGSASGTTVIVNQASGTDGGLVCSSSGNNGCAEKLTASSVLQGQSFNKITVGLKKSLTPTGTLTVGVMNASKAILLNCGTLDITTLTTSYVAHSFTCPNTYTVSGVVYVGISSPTQAGGANVLVGSTNPNQFDTTNSIASQWLTGGTNAWVDASTWDLGSSTSNGAWKLELTGSTYMDVDFTAHDHLLITAELRVNATDTFHFRLNNDTGSNYALRTTISGTTTALTSKTTCDFLNSGTITTGDRPLLVMWINNNQAGDRKIVLGDFGSGLDTSATTAPTNVDFSCKWSNTSSQVNNLTLLGKFTTNSTVTVWGYN